jgi:hypothetical protein
MFPFLFQRLQGVHWLQSICNSGECTDQEVISFEFKTVMSSEQNQFYPCLPPTTQWYCTTYPQSAYLHWTADQVLRSSWKFKSKLGVIYRHHALLFPSLTIYVLWSAEFFYITYFPFSLLCVQLLGKWCIHESTYDFCCPKNMFHVSTTRSLGI